MQGREVTREELDEWDRIQKREKAFDELVKIIKPFLKTANGIPDNWPKECSLFYEIAIDRHWQEYGYLNYHKAGVDAGPTIGDYKKLEEWCKENGIKD